MWFTEYLKNDIPVLSKIFSSVYFQYPQRKKVTVSDNKESLWS